LMVFVVSASSMLPSGVGHFFMAVSAALAGRFRGGPANVAVLPSGLYGTISGSSVADCYATGSFTIPLMKKIGYKPEIAGAIEACASCGGPLMPPIMGAGAFIMAELTGVPYSKIVVAAALPAVLYYVGIMATVHWEAIKQRIGTMRAEVPSLMTLLRRALLFMPFVIVIYFLEAGYSPSKAALYSLLSAVFVSWFAGDQPMTPRRIFETMGEAMRSGVIVATVLAASGLIVASMSRTGFALAFSSTIINLSGGYLILALLLIFLVVSVLGTGIPTTPAYILAVTVGGAALQRLRGCPDGGRGPDADGLASLTDSDQRVPGAVPLRLPAGPADGRHPPGDRDPLRLSGGRHFGALRGGRRLHVQTAHLAPARALDRCLARGDQSATGRVGRHQPGASRIRGVGLVAGATRCGAVRQCRGALMRRSGADA